MKKIKAVLSRTYNGVSGTFRRVGFEFNKNIQEYEVTPEQLELIKAEPMVDIIGKEKDEETTDEKKEKAKKAKNK